MKQFTSHIDFSLTRKRFKMMVQHFSPLSSYSKKVVLLPVLLALTLLFCTNQNTKDGLIAHKIRKGIETDMYESEPVLYSLKEDKPNELFQFYPTMLNENGEPYTGTRRFYNLKTNETGWEEVYNEGVITKIIYHSDAIKEMRNASYITYQFKNGKYVAETVYDTSKSLSYRSEYTDNVQLSYGPEGQLIFHGITIDGNKWAYQKWWDLNGNLEMESSLVRDSSGTQQLRAIYYDEEGNIKDQRYVRGQIRYF